MEKNMEKSKLNCNVHITIIIVLLVIIAILGFFLWKNYNNLFTGNGKNITNNKDDNKKTDGADIKFLVIDDKRCNNCQTDVILNQLKQIPALASVNVEKKDFTDEWVEKYIKDNNIKALPAFIFDNNQIDQNINQYLQELPSKEYSLLIGASFDPFAKRSAKWFLTLDKDKLKKIKDSSYIKWNADAKITWLEYSDLECPFCAKLHDSWTPEEIVKKYGEKLNIIFNHFPLEFHKNALPGAQIMECIWELNWSDTFYKVLDVAYKWRDISKAEDNSRQSSKEFLVDEAAKLWVNKANLEKCITDNKYLEKVQWEQKTGAELFSISWTPWNVLINNETWEYEVISWAYPTESFVTIIDNLLK